MRTIIISTETRNEKFIALGSGRYLAIVISELVCSSSNAVTFARRLFEDPVIMTRYRDMMRTMLNEVWDDEII